MTQDEFPFEDHADHEHIPARHSDPFTSQQSGRRISEDHPIRFSAKSAYYRILLRFRASREFAERYSIDDRGFTDEEVAKLVSPVTAEHCNIETPRKRCSELRQMNYIVVNGMTRLNPGSPDEARVCVVTDGGLRALARVEETGWNL